MFRSAALLIAPVVAVILAPSPAEAQPFYGNRPFSGGFGGFGGFGGSPYGNVPYFPAYSPPTNPFRPLAQYRFQPYVGVPATSVYGPVVIGQGIPYYSPLNNVTNMPFYNWYLRPGQLYSQAGSGGYAPWASAGASGYMSGGGGGYSSGYSPAQYAIAQGQYETSRYAYAAARSTSGGYDTAKDLISDQWVYEKLGAAGLAVPKPGAANAGEELVKALAVQDEAELASGDALNHILAAVATAEVKGAKGPSAFLPPRVLADVRFAGGPTADALNLLRQAGDLPFPAAFDAPELKDARDALARDFAAAADPLVAGRPVDPAKLTRLETTLRKTEEAAAPVVRALPFDEATAARGFLNRFAAAVTALKTQGAVGLVPSSWPVEGASVTDLVRHMARHKLVFGPAAPGGEPAYLSLHRALATYLFALNPTPKK